MSKKNIIISLYSHFDTNIYSAEETTELAMKCKAEGAEMIHLHIDKLGGTEEFARFLKKLEEMDGPMVNLSVSDYQRYVDYDDHISSRVRVAAIIGADCVVFGNKISKSFEELLAGVNEYIQKGLFPEVSVFNMEGVENCIRLNKIFPKQFFAGVYMGYPEQMAASVENIKEVADKLRECSFVSYTVFDNLTRAQIEAIVAENGYIRGGMEDQNFICGVKIENPIVGIRAINEVLDVA